MAYLGNDLQVAYQSYKIVDDISISFNSSLTSFALQVGGVAPVPFPINPQQCLISVNGVVQEPDPTGTSGFNLVGSNIVFASAPTTGHSFFGVILAGADYVNVGVNYPSGSESAPSITFNTDLDTGIYNPAANELGLVTNGNEALRIDSAGDVTIGSDLTVDTDTLYVDSANNIVGIGTTSPSELLQVDGGNLLVRNNSGNNITLSTNVGNKNDSNFIFQKARGGSSGPTQIVADDNLGSIEWQGYDGSSYNEAATIISRARTNTGNFDADLIYDANRHNFKNNSSSSVFIDSSGRLLIGTIASPAYQLQVSTDSAGKPSTNTWTIVSDERIKEDIELADLDICYEAVKNIPLKRFKWKNEVYTEEQVPDRHKLGWIAQDVESVFPKAVCIHEFKYNQVFEETVIPAVEEELDEDGNVITPAQPERVEKGELISEDVIEDCRDLNADQLYAAMYGAIQKLIAKVETLEAKVATLENV